jgi:hypothetical protein
MQTTAASRTKASLQNHLPVAMNVGFYTEVVDKLVGNVWPKSLGF